MSALPCAFSAISSRLTRDVWDHTILRRPETALRQDLSRSLASRDTLELASMRNHLSVCRILHRLPREFSLLSRRWIDFLIEIVQWTLRSVVFGENCREDFLESIGIERKLRIVIFYNISCLIIAGVYIIEALWFSPLSAIFRSYNRSLCSDKWIQLPRVRLIGQ